MEILRVECLAKDFGGVRALRNVSFSVETGERLAIIGPNGAGKTTLFNVLHGQLSPSAGRVYVFGQDITHMATYRRTHLGIARSFQITSLFSNLTVVDNTLLALQGTEPSRFGMFRSINAYKDTLSRAQELLEAWALWERRDDYIRNIAYGDQRRLEIALSLASNPKILLLDEPSAGLTAAESADITEKIDNLGKDVTVILIAHDMDLVFGVAERIICLHYGEIIAEGTCDEILDDLRVKEVYMGIEESAYNAGTN